MITFLLTYWGPLLFLANLLFWVAQGIRFRIKYRSWKPFWLMIATFVVISLAATILVFCFHAST